MTTSLKWSLRIARKHITSLYCLELPGGSAVKNLPARAGKLGQEDSQEKKMASHSSILAWEIPWTEEPGGL